MLAHTVHKAAGTDNKSAERFGANSSSGGSLTAFKSLRTAGDTAASSPESTPGLPSVNSKPRIGGGGAGALASAGSGSLRPSSAASSQGTAPTPQQGSTPPGRAVNGMPPRPSHQRSISGTWGPMSIMALKTSMGQHTSAATQLRLTSTVTRPSRAYACSATAPWHEPC